MPSTELLFHIGSGAFVFIGVGHSVTELVLGVKEPAAELVPALKVMRETQFQLPGRRVAMDKLMRGYSLMMGLLLCMVGVVGHQLAAGAEGQLVLITSYLACSLVGLYLSLRYFFILPMVATAVASVCFALAAAG